MHAARQGFVVVLHGDSLAAFGGRVRCHARVPSHCLSVSVREKVGLAVVSGALCFRPCAVDTGAPPGLNLSRLRGSVCVCVNFKTTPHSTTALMRARPRALSPGGRAYMTTGNRPASGAPLSVCECICSSVGMDAPRAVGNAGARGRGFCERASPHRVSSRVPRCHRVCVLPC